MPSIHKATPAEDEQHCAVCGQWVKRVPGGHGPTWVHRDSGAVAAPNPPRFYVHDRKVGDLTVISAINPRFWVIDRTTGKMVDEFVSKAAATGTARDLNRESA